VTRALLITQCLQRDFVAPLASHAPLPNLLHVGAREATRLLGPDPSAGPVAQLARWAREQDGASLAIAHVRDLHDANDPRQQSHLAAFGAHCIAGTEGAKLVCDLENEMGCRERFVDSKGLSDFEGTDFEPWLRAWMGDDDPRALRVAVVGVWTEAKVTFLLYDLATRLGLTSLATSSALTASASRAAHFQALEQLRKVLGVTVFDSVGDLAGWLAPSIGFASTSTRLRTFTTRIEGAELSDDERDVVTHLYRDAARVVLTPLAGGFSGARVLAANSEDALGHAHAASVLKLGPRGAIGAERAAFERVEEVLGNDAPRLLGAVDHATVGGLRFAFAAMGGGAVRTFKTLYESGAPLADLEKTLRAVFEGTLGRFYRAATYERLPLLAYYGFSSRHADSVEAHARAAAWPRDRAYVDEIVSFYREGLAELGEQPGEHHYVSFVHGDLNGANVLLDGRGNVWLIDFAHTKRGHVLGDLVKMENDLLFLFTKLGDDDFAQGLVLLRALSEVEDLRAPLPETLAELTSPELVRAWNVVRILRAFGSAIVREDRDPRQHRIAALRYAAHTMSFEEASPIQRRLAMVAAAMHARALRDESKADRSLRIGWLDARPGRLGMTLCPGRKDRGRDLDADLEALRARGTSVLVTLTTKEELAWAGVPDLEARARAAGFETIVLPIRDQEAPSDAAMHELTGAIRERLDAGSAVVVHCMGGLGRSGLVAACVLVDRGRSPLEALAAVREARGPRAVESPAQERALVAHARSWQERER
jgi:protein-tyrosine phosphatase/nicotinamidase-related amidase/Ser/Thr protein kinase RdoA (MazF antagonist)